MSKNPNLRGASRKGIPNKMNGEIRAMIHKALERAGGALYLEQQAEENPAAFLTLLGKTLPREVTGLDGGPINSRIEVSVNWTAPGSK